MSLFPFVSSPGIRIQLRWRKLTVKHTNAHPHTSPGPLSESICTSLIAQFSDIRTTEATETTAPNLLSLETLCYSAGRTPPRDPHKIPTIKL